MSVILLLVSLCILLYAAVQQFRALTQNPVCPVRSSLGQQLPKIVQWIVASLCLAFGIYDFTGGPWWFLVVFVPASLIATILFVNGSAQILVRMQKK